jgi:hypothetical protein
VAADVLVASIGLRITLRHHFDFGPDRPVVGDDLVRPEAWDALRTQTDGAFSLAGSREELDRAAEERPEIGERARAIETWLREGSVRTLASYGVGGAVLEAWLQRLDPERRLLLADYAPETVERLRALFPRGEVVRHDLLVDPPLTADAHLFHRIDTELSDEQWAEVLRRFARETVLVVATDVATARSFAQELLLRARSRRLTRAGWLRNRSAFEALWSETHDATPLRLHDLEGWALTPRRA